MVTCFVAGCEASYRKSTYTIITTVVVVEEEELTDTTTTR